MLKKPDIAEDLISCRLQDEYGLPIKTLTLLPLGADVEAAVYRLITVDGRAYFCKIKRNFNDILIKIPLFLKSKGVEEIIVPLATTSKQYCAKIGDYTMILYNFVEGKNGFEISLSDHQKRSLGCSLKKIHSLDIPNDLKKLIKKETFSPNFRVAMRAFLRTVKQRIFQEKIAKDLSSFINNKYETITIVINRADILASNLSSMPLEYVLCHADFHGGNVLIDHASQIFIVDWDAPLLAPKERDLMFIGGGIDKIWLSKRDEALFYEGYGKTEVNLTALAYYRCERILVDMVELCEQLLLTETGAYDREQALQWFTYNFEPGSTIDIAMNTPHENHKRDE